MSLINQVLRDLDRRHGAATPPAAGLKAARAAAPAGMATRLRLWGLGLAATAAAIVAGGVAQGSIAWPQRAPVAVPVAAGVAGVAVNAIPAAPVASTAPASAAVPAASAVPSPAPALAMAPPLVAEPAASMPAPALPALQLDPHLSPAVMVALAPPSARAAAPIKKRTVDVATPAGKAPAIAPSPAAAEARIAKYSAERTPQERAEAHYQRGVTAHQAGQINDSATAFMAALREDPRHVAARQAQAGLLIGQQRSDEAMALLQEGMALGSPQPVIALMLARLQAERQELTAAAETLKSADSLALRNAEYQGTYAAILQRAQRHAEAADKYGAALRLSPGHSVWWMGLGISLAAAGQSEAAREAFVRARATGGLPAEAGQYVDARLRQLM